MDGIKTSFPETGLHANFDRIADCFKNKTVVKKLFAELAI